MNGFNLTPIQIPGQEMKKAWVQTSGFAILWSQQSRKGSDADRRLSWHMQKIWKPKLSRPAGNDENYWSFVVANLLYNLWYQWDGRKGKPDLVCLSKIEEGHCWPTAAWEQYWENLICLRGEQVPGWHSALDEDLIQNGIAYLPLVVCGEVPADFVKQGVLHTE